MEGIEINRHIKAFIFDLDGVITDTAEYHFRSWKRLADDEEIPFTREDNEQFRGVPRERCLELLLGEREVSEAEFEEMMERKNRYYRGYLKEVSGGDLLPGARKLLEELGESGYKLALASASKNARTVVDRLGIGELFDMIADGYSVERQKPAPDLFLYAAREMGVEPEEAVVVEDARAGIDAALAGGMTAVGIGPAERVGHADLRYQSVREIDLRELLKDI